MFYIFHVRSQALHLCFHAHTESNALVLSAPQRIMSTDLCWDGSAAAAAASAGTWQSLHRNSDAAFLPVSVNLIYPHVGIILYLISNTVPLA